MKASRLFYFLPFIVALGFILLGGPQLLYPDKPDANIKSEAETFLSKARDALMNGDVLPSLDSKPLSTDSEGSSNLYRWQDENGQWHFSNIPPEQGDKTGADATVQVSQLPEAVNSIPPPPKMPASSASSAVSNPRVPAPTTVNPMDIPKLLEQAKNLQGLMDQRSQQIDHALKK